MSQAGGGLTGRGGLAGAGGAGKGTGARAQAGPCGSSSPGPQPRPEEAPGTGRRLLQGLAGAVRGDISSHLLAAARSGTRTCGLPAEPRGRAWQAKAAARRAPAAGAGQLWSPGEPSLHMDGGTSSGASGRDPAALGTFQGEENELGCWSEAGAACPLSEIPPARGCSRACIFAMCECPRPRERLQGNVEIFFLRTSFSG